MKAFLALLILTLGVALGSESVFAHATLIESDPADGTVLRAAPKQVTLSFGEPVSPLVLRLLNADGRVVTLSKFRQDQQSLIVDMPADIAAGTSILSWRVTSQDGHPIGGTVTFSVDRSGSANVAPTVEDQPGRLPLWLLHVLHLAGLAGVVGGAVFLAWVARGDLRRPALVIQFAAPLAGVVALTRFGAEASDAVGDNLVNLMNVSLWWGPVSETLGGSLLSSLAALTLAFLSARATRRGARLLSVAALVLVGLAFALSGHAAVASPQYLMKPSIFLHIAAVLFWSGSLVPLFMLLRTGTAVRETLIGYSSPVLIAVAALTTTGGVLAVFQLGAFAELWNSGYGVVLSLKLAALLPLLGLASVNRIYLTPRVKAGDPAAARTLRYTIGAEIAVVVLIFGLVSLWRFTPPPREMSAVTVLSTGIQFHAHGTRGMANLIVSPARPGPVRISVNVMDVQSRPFDVRGVDVILVDPENRIESIRSKARRVTAASWQIDDLTIPTPGAWLVRIDLLVSDFDKISIRSILKIKQR